MDLFPSATMPFELKLKLKLCYQLTLHLCNVPEKEGTHQRGKRKIVVREVASQVAYTETPADDCCNGGGGGGCGGGNAAAAGGSSMYKCLHW